MKWIALFLLSYSMQSFAINSIEDAEVILDDARIAVEEEKLRERIKDQTLQEEDFASLKDLQKLKKRNREERRKIKNRHMRFFQKKRLRESLEELDNKKARFVYVKKGSYIYSLNEQKRFIVPRELYVKVKWDEYREGVYFVVDKETERPLYKVEREYIFPIRYVSDLKVRPLKFEFQNPLERRYLVDYGPTIVNHIFLHYETLYLPIVPEVIGVDQANSKLLPRLEYNLMLDWKLPFRFGAMVDIQAPSWEDSTGQNVRLIQLTGGINISYPYSKIKGKRETVIELGGFKSGYSRVNYTNRSNEQVNTSLRSYGFQVKWYRNYIFPNTNISLGAAYRQMNEGISSSNDSLEIDSSTKTSYSVGGFLGVQF